MKTKIIPFDLETAKKIQAGEIEGRIVTEDGYPARILAFDLCSKYYPLCVAWKNNITEDVAQFTKDGIKWSDTVHLVIELPEEAQKHEFKPFDKVLVHNEGGEWCCAFFSHMDYSLVTPSVITADGYAYKYCIPYEGHEYLVGTTDKPKED
jgi:hypothetical protein